MKIKLDHAELLSVMDYNPITGIFTWKVNTGKKRMAGLEAGALDVGTGYRRIRVLHTRWWAHRLAWFYVYGEVPVYQIDHRDGCRTNNSIENLRQATHSENCQNQRIGRSTRKGKPLGAFYNKRKGFWYSKITVNHKTISLGTFRSEEEAALAYLDAKRRLHPFQTMIEDERAAAASTLDK